MHLVTVKDSMTGESYTYDADMPINSADSGMAFYISQLTNLEAKIYETKYRNIIYPELVPVDTSDPEWVDSVSYISYDAVTMGSSLPPTVRICHSPTSTPTSPPFRLVTLVTATATLLKSCASPNNCVSHSTLPRLPLRTVAPKNTPRRLRSSVIRPAT